MVKFSAISLGYTKHTPEEVQMVKITKETLLHSGNEVKLPLQVFCATVSIV